MIDAVIRALTMGLAMGWEILWPLILGFALSAVVQAVVSHQQMSQLLPDDRPRSIATALALGAASLLRSRCACPVDLPERRAFHRRDGVRDGFHQSRPRAHHHHGGTPGLAVDAG
jgi:hypothetical protein